MKTKLPEFLKSCFWSYNLSDLDKDKSKNLIITQIINYGDKDQVQWMEKNYTQEEIMQVVTHPTRGLWWRDKLRMWLKRFGVMIDPLLFEIAINDINPRPKSLYEAFFNRVGRGKNAIAQGNS